MEPLPAEEVPEEIEANTLCLPTEYFQRNESGFKLPRILKRSRTESDIGYELRIKNYLLNMDDKTFMNVSEVIDPTDIKQIPFFDLFNDIMDQRTNEPTKSSKCTIF